MAQVMGPPSDYNTFMPSLPAPAFPARGSAYTDPTFGSAVTRLTNEVGQSSFSDIYSKNGYWSADAKLMVHNTRSGRSIIRVPSGETLIANVPGNDNSCFDPIDPNVWWWWNHGDTVLRKFNIATGQSTAVKTFSAPLGNNGGSIDWIDRTGRYMVLHLGNKWQLYDVQANALYANPIPDTYGNSPGYTGITPDGKYIITTKNANPNAHRSWAVDHAGRSISMHGNVFWTLCGDHGDFISASNGKNYMVVMECDSIAALYAVDVSLAQSHDDKAKQLNEARQILKLSWSDSIHASRVSYGPRADWCFVCVESGDDLFNSTVSPWRPFMQEILMVNVLTGEVRRLAHHRSRSPFANYYYQPRVSASWDGSRVAWASNMNTATPNGYADIYSIAAGEAPNPEPPDPPEPEPTTPAKLWLVEDEYVLAPSMVDAIGAWKVHHGTDDDPSSAALAADEVISADDAAEPE